MRGFFPPTGMGCHFLLPGSSRPRDRNSICCTAGVFFTTEPQGKCLSSCFKDLLLPSLYTVMNDVFSQYVNTFNPTWIYSVLWYEFILFYCIWNENNISEAICLPPLPWAVRYLLLCLYIQFSVIWKSALVSAADSSSSIIPSPRPSSTVSHISSYTQRGIRKEKLQSSSHTLYALARCFRSFAGFNPQTTKSVIIPFYEDVTWASALSHNSP